MVDEEYRVQEEDDEEEEEEEKEGEGHPDLLSRLLKTRTIIISGDIDKKLTQRVMSELLLLEEEDPDKEITLFVNSPGGDGDAGLAIYDMIRFIRPPVRAVCTGITASAATIILLGAEKKNRYSLPNARILIHEPRTGARGRATDIEVNATEALRFREKLNKLIAQETGQSIEKVAKDTLKDYWMSAEEAKDYGIVTKIIEDRSGL